MTIVGFIAYSIYDCATTGCISTHDEAYEDEVRKKAVNYAINDCYKSYQNDRCKSLQISGANFFCGLRGFCGWTVEVSIDKDEFKYHSSASLESKNLSGYQVTRYSEDKTPYTEHVSKIFIEMCQKYGPTQKIGCDKLQLSPIIEWRGDNGQDTQTPVGATLTYLDPYAFQAKIRRDGKVLKANITNFEENSDKVLYTYKSIQ